MNKILDLWLESQVHARVADWCKRLDWSFKRWPYSIDVECDDFGRLSVGWDVFDDAPSICLVLNISDIGEAAAWTSELLLFVLRRNIDTAHLHWCVSRRDGLAVTATRPVEGMTFESFRDLVGKLNAERGELLRLARLEFTPEPPADKQEPEPTTSACPKCGTEMKIPASMRGKRARCLKCGEAMAIGQ